MNEPKKPYTKLQLEYILEFYDAQVRGLDLQTTAQLLDVSLKKLKRQLDQYPSLQKARAKAKSKKQTAATFTAYVFGRLSPEAQECWTSIQFWESEEMAQSPVEALLRPKPVRLKQELFVHALVKANWNRSEACRMIGVDLTTLHDWESDPGFAGLLAELNFHKKNFFEGALVKLVADGNPAAVIHVNKTINADRGYNDKLVVQHTGRVEMGRGIDIDALDLDIDTRRKILDAIRRQKENVAFADAKPILTLPEKAA